MEISASRQVLTLLSAGATREELLVECALEQLKKTVEQQILRRLDTYEFPTRDSLEVKKQLQAFQYTTSSLQELYRSHEQLRMLIRRAKVPFLELSIGHYMRLGAYNGEPILWRIINVEEGGELLLVSEHILSLKPFSAAGELDGDLMKHEEARFGSNHWGRSYLRAWLNSEQRRVSYRGQTPTKPHVWNGYNAYAREHGFLADGNFSQEERQLIKARTEQRNGYTVTDRVSLLSQRVLQEHVIARGWETTARPTSAALVQSTFKHPSISSKLPWMYLLADPHPTAGHLVRTVTAAGELSDGYAYDGSQGIRPLLLLKSGVRRSGEGTTAHPYVVAK